ncbi:LOW QUALITY PROTEIN: protein ZNRD2 [Haemorhous mexicanus]|uniref:LOW QUALITY PROTEIN: protein ZNRD2 n=1 Tax=Haemorhous mexicanus TaxID=30427 RepID=UPI0028BF4C48|nr:LOW QUALITY PROTEIN: protein ZNRD2 [Haemorhous mexicanus]
MALNGGTDEVEARRERLDRASRAMGALLLRGYRMLGSSCPVCGTVLLQDKEQRLLCVSCQDPEGGHAPPAPPRPEHCEGAAAAFRGSPPAAPGPPGAASGTDAGSDGGTGAAVAAARAALLQKLLWAARELPRSCSVEGSARLCRLVRDCALALRGLRDLEPPGSHPGPPPGHPDSPGVL